MTLIVVTYNSEDEIAACLQSIRDQQTTFSREVVVVDNASRDGTVRRVQEDAPEVHLVANTINVGFGAANNQALRVSRGRFILLVNPDSVLQPGAVQSMVDYVEAHPECGICGGLLMDEEKHIHPSARRFSNPLRKLLMMSGIQARLRGQPWFKDADFGWFDHRTPLRVDWVPGAFTLIRRELIDELGLFDERFFLYFEETDLCLRANRNGWEVHFVPDSVCIHVGGASSRKHASEAFDVAGSQVLKFRARSECLFYRKNFGVLAVWLNLGVELLWHGLRVFLHRGGNETSQRKRIYSQFVFGELWRALKETRTGALCPPLPW